MECKVINLLKDSRFQLLCKLTVSAVLFFYIISRINFDVLNLLNGFVIIYVLISIFITLLGIFIMTLRWNFLLRKIYQVRSYLNDLFKLYLIGTFFSIFLPGAIGGDVTRIHNSNKKYGLGLKRASIIILTERATGLIGVVLLFCFGSLIITDFYTSLKYDKFWIFFFILAIFASIILLKIYLKKKIALNYRFILLILFLSIVAQFSDIIIAYLYCSYFNVSISFFTLMVIIPIVYITSIVPISLGGLGVREGTMAVLFSLIGADPSIAVIISLLIYLSKVIVGGVGGIVYIKTNNKKSDYVTESLDQLHR